jgi:hypothetical protein
MHVRVDQAGQQCARSERNPARAIRRRDTVHGTGVGNALSLSHHARGSHGARPGLIESGV